jgi:MFS family permease
MHFDQAASPPAAATSNQPWYRELNRYHWFVLIVSALGWMFDCLDQQLFNLARGPAMDELRAGLATKFYGGLATMIFMVGWATGGIIFGIMGDRFGRAKTMVWTIGIYSICTGLSALSQNFWQFGVFRFLTGLGVGGEFAVGVALVAEVMPERARAHALGWLQALSAVGNVTAAVLDVGLLRLQNANALPAMASWRWMFVVGALPAVLALLIRRRLKEPERWVALREAGVAPKELGSMRELFGDRRWRRGALVGLGLAVPGVIGLWGIGFFSFELVRSVFRETFETELRAQDEGKWDQRFVRAVIHNPDDLKSASKQIKSGNEMVDKDAKALYGAALKLQSNEETVSASAVVAAVSPPTDADRERLTDYLGEATTGEDLDELIAHIKPRTKNMSYRLEIWAALNSLLFNIGAFFGIYAFKNFTQWAGRKITFGLNFAFALITTALTFWFLDRFAHIFLFVPVMGFFQIALFGGYAIYFPELFPTRLRSSGTSFCYNVGRYVAAAGPLMLGFLADSVFGNFGDVMSWRLAGVTMCSFFLVGIAVLPFARETKGQPLPE